MEFLKSSETKTLNGRVKEARSQNVINRQCIQKGEISVLDFIVMKNRNSKEAEMHACAADVGRTDNCLIWTESTGESCQEQTR